MALQIGGAVPTFFRAIAIAILSCVPSVAFAQIDCSSPTGIGTRACLFPEGQLVVETSFVDWTKDDDSEFHSDSVTVGDTLLRFGVRKGLELQLGIAPYTHERTRDLADGETVVSNGVGNLSLGAKLALVDAADHPFGIAIQPTLIIPLSRFRVGAGGIGGGVVLPITYDLSDRLSASLTPEINYSGDRDDSGRHFVYGVTAGLDFALGRKFTASLEYHVARDIDPALPRTENLVACSLGWTASRRVQFNIGAVKGLTSRSPDLELIAGMALHFF